MDTTDTLKLNGDRAKRSLDDGDEFGLTDFVKALTSTLKGRITADGYVIGVEGEWGSGKSSFINYVIDDISKRELQHEVIRFEPWLIGNRDRLLIHFFELLASRIDHLAASNFSLWQPWKWLPIHAKHPLKVLSKKIRQYGSYAATLSAPLSAAANIDPSGTTTLASIGTKVLSFISQLFKKPTLDKLKASIESDLSGLIKIYPELRFIVVIDDLDRLEPTETAEILRLISKVANFPLVTYLLCFDRKILVDHIKTSLKVDGDDYLEKIIQQTLPLPPQEAFALRRLLQRFLSDSFPEAMSFSKAEDIKYEDRRRTLFDTWAGALLKTPRDVVRLHEAVKFGWPYLAGNADFLDFVWLQLIKLKARPLYDWTRTYVSEVGAYRDRGKASEGQDSAAAESLQKIIDGLGWHGDLKRFSGLYLFLPGVENYVLDGTNKKVFKFGQNELANFERDRRLGSPSHWRKYFAFSIPSYAITDDLLSEFLTAAATDTNKAVYILRELSQKPHQHPNHFVEVLLDRLIDLSAESLSPEQISGIAMSFAEIMDTLDSRELRTNEFGRNQIWSKATRLLRNRAINFENLFRNGKSINWLAETLRSFASAHGLPEGRENTPDNHWLTWDQLQNSIKIMIDRFRAIGVREILSYPAPIQILYCWSQLGDESEVRSLVDEAIIDDETFLAFIASMQNQVSSSNKGVYSVVKERYVSSFTNPVAAKSRLEALATSDTSFSAAAQELLQSWRSSDWD